MPPHIGLCFVLLGTYLLSLLFLYECSKLDGYKFPVYSTEFCPRYQIEWEQRSSAINCNKSNGYMCSSNENKTELLEFCYLYPFIWMEEGVCLYLSKRSSRFMSYNCSDFISGCPSVNYMSSKSFQYLTCTFIGNGCFLAEPNCSSTIPSYVQTTTEKIQRDNVTTYGRNEIDTNYSKKSTVKISVENDPIGNNNELFFDYPSFLGILVPFCALGVLLLVFYLIRDIPSDIESHRYEEEVPFIQEEEQHDIRNSSGMQLPNSCSHSSESPREQAIFEQWQQDNMFFIPTRASEEVEKVAREQNLVIVTGHSGSGKSAIIQHIALKYRSNGWNVKPIDEIDEFLGEFTPGKMITNKTLFVFHDPLGIVSIDEMKFSKWRTHEATLKACLKKVKLIVSYRKCILNDGRVKGLLKDKSKLVDISQDQLKLNNDEKQRIWNRYSSNKISFMEASIEFFNIEAYFPLLCKLYFSNDRNTNGGLRFFSEPSEVLEEEIENFRLYSKETYYALVLLVLFNGALDVEDIPDTETSKRNFELALELCEVVKKPALHTIADTLNNLKGFLVKKIGDTFHFNHDFVMEVTTYVFGKYYPKALIKYADIGFLRKKVRLQSSENQNNPLTLYLRNTDKADLGKRLCCATFGKDLLDVVLNPCLKDENVIEGFIHELSQNSLKLEKLLEKKKLQIENENLNELPEAKKLISSKFAFMKLENETSPLNALIVFGHKVLSLYCLIALKQKSISFKDQLLFSSVCCNGSLDMFFVFSEDEIIQKCLREKWGTLYPIYIASTFHNTDILNELIGYHKLLDIKVDNKDGCTPLILAAAYDSCEFDENFKEKTNETKRNETIQLILRNGANINQCDKEGTSPLHVACQEGYDSTVELLLGSRANINLRDKDGTSPLFVACQEGHHSTVQILLNKGANINLCDKDGTSPLFVACQEGHDLIVELLLNKEAEIDLCDREKASPLFIACQEGHERIVQLLLDKGAKINSCDEGGTTPLFVACQEGHDSNVQLVLYNRAEINLCDEEGTNPHYVACQEGRELTGEHLLNNGAEIDLCDREKASPLFIACQEGHERIVQILLSKGADINECDEDGMSPLFIACQEGHINTVELLLNNEADVNLCDEDETSPLYIACQEGHKNAVQLLLSKGADINSCDNKRASPLFIACRKGYDDIVKLLIDKGANINLSEINGISPLCVAFALRHFKTVNILLGCDPDSSVLHGCGSNSLSLDCYNKDDQPILFLQQSNIIDNIYDFDSFFSLFLFCQVEQMLRKSE